MLELRRGFESRERVSSHVAEHSGLCLVEESTKQVTNFKLNFNFTKTEFCLLLHFYTDFAGN